MTVRVYRSTDTSAPVLSGTAGALISVLDAVLVNGYGAQVAAGWTKPFSGTNLASYRQGTGSNNFYLKVRDDAPVTAQEAQIRGFEVMTQVTSNDTGADGTSLFPTIAQSSALLVRKSSVSDSSSRTWMIVADQRTFYLFILSGDVAAHYFSTMFGEIYSFKTSDSYRTAIVSRAATGGLGTSENFGSMTFSGALGGVAQVQTGHYLARDASGSAGAVAANELGNGGCNSSGTTTISFSNTNNLNMKNVTDHKVYLFPIRIGHIQGGNTVRGRYRGFWQAAHNQSTLSDGDTFTGSGSLAGKTFMVVRGIGFSGIVGAACIETSDTWDSN